MVVKICWRATESSSQSSDLADPKIYCHANSCALQFGGRSFGSDLERIRRYAPHI
jgi:hypothetical protein